jgi:hypothetical protein
MSQFLWHKRKVHWNYPAAGHTPYVNCGAVSNVSRCSTRVFWSPRFVHSLCGPSLKCGMQLHQKGWFSSGIHCICQVSHQEWSLQISYVLYPVIWKNCMEHLQPAIHRRKHFHNALCTVECDTCNSCTAAQVNLGFVSIFIFFYTGNNDLMYFWASYVVNLRIRKGLFSFLSSMAEADVLCVAA